VFWLYGGRKGCADPHLGLQLKKTHTFGWGARGSSRRCNGRDSNGGQGYYKNLGKDGKNLREMARRHSASYDGISQSDYLEKDEGIVN